MRVLFETEEAFAARERELGLKENEQNQNTFVPVEELMRKGRNKNAIFRVKR